MASTDLVPAQLTKEQAKALTRKIKRTADDVWVLLEQAFRGCAWTALGYRSWRAYVQHEFAMSESHSYRLLDQAWVVRELQETTGVEVRVSGRQARAIKGRVDEVGKAAAEAAEGLTGKDRQAAIEASVAEAARPDPSRAREESPAEATAPAEPTEAPQDAVPAPTTPPPAPSGPPPLPSSPPPPLAADEPAQAPENADVVARRVAQAAEVLPRILKLSPGDVLEQVPEELRSDLVANAERWVQRLKLAHSAAEGRAQMQRAKDRFKDAS